MPHLEDLHYQVSVKIYHSTVHVPDLAFTFSCLAEGNLFQAEH